MDDEAVKTKPILFSGPMVRALLEGRKTQTRRRCGDHLNIYDTVSSNSAKTTFDFHNVNSTGQLETCPYGQPGDLLWVRETWWNGTSIPGCGRVKYRADEDLNDFARNTGGNWKPSIHMPRWASRLTLEITDVRVQRVQDISEKDAKAEGVAPLFSEEEISKTPDCAMDPMPYANYLWHGHIGHTLTEAQAREWPFQYSGYSKAAGSFSSLWASINGAESWAANHWVWCLTFSVHHQNVDSLLQAREAA